LENLNGYLVAAGAAVNLTEDFQGLMRFAAFRVSDDRGDAGAGLKK
jgi:hypothetical protein